MRSKLQTKLTVTHLLVTVVSVLILAALMLGGYFVYLRTDLPAEWAGGEAAAFAGEISYRVDLEDEHFDQTFGCLFVEEYFGLLCDDVPLTPEDEVESFEVVYDAEMDDWLILTDSQGRILASTVPEDFAVGDRLHQTPPPGFRAAWFSDAEQINFDNQERWVRYAIEDNHYVGFAPIVSDTDGVLGWVYFRANDRGVGALIAQGALYLGGGLLGAAVIALLVSGLMGGVLARSFSQRLEQLRNVSKKWGEGDLVQRVPVTGADEIAQVGVQFNAMADRIGAQMKELRTLADQNAKLAQEASGLAQLEERNRLARELHDAIKQQLFGLNLSAGALPALLEQDPQLAKTRLGELTQITQQVLEEMDQIILQLRPASLGDMGLVVALQTLVNQWQTQTGIVCELKAQSERELPIAVEESCYRIAQEALNNVARHANATNVEVTLNYQMNEVTLLIQDNGCGFDPQANRGPQSLGLSNMQERAAEVGGDIRIDSAPGDGTFICVRVPHQALSVRETQEAHRG